MLLDIEEEASIIKTEGKSKKHQHSVKRPQHLIEAGVRNPLVFIYLFIYSLEYCDL